MFHRLYFEMTPGEMYWSVFNHVNIQWQ